MISNDLYMSIIGPRKVILNKTWCQHSPTHCPAPTKVIRSSGGGGVTASWIWKQQLWTLCNYTYSTQDLKAHLQSSGCCWQFGDCKYASRFFHSWSISASMTFQRKQFSSGYIDTRGHIWKKSSWSQSSICKHGNESHQDFSWNC